MARKKALKRVSSNVDSLIWIREKTTFIDIFSLGYIIRSNHITYDFGRQ